MHEVQPLLGQIARVVSAAIVRTRPKMKASTPSVRRSEHANFESNAAQALGQMRSCAQWKT